MSAPKTDADIGTGQKTAATSGSAVDTSIKPGPDAKVSADSSVDTNVKAVNGPASADSSVETNVRGAPVSKVETHIKTAAKPDERTILFDARGQRRDGATVVIEMPEAPEARCKLVVVSGARQGKEYVLHGTEVNLGRDERNDIVIPDIAVSRRHVRLRRDAEGWTVSSVPDGGLVRVNGLKIDSYMLTSGDIVELGKIELQFVEADPSSVVWLRRLQSQSRELTKASVVAPPKRTNRRVRKVAIGCLAAVSFALILRSVLDIGHDRVDVTVQTDQRSAEEVFAAARDEVRAQNWAEALALLKRAAARAPDDEQVRHTLEVVVQESKNQDHLDAALKAMAAGDLKKADSELSAIGQGTLMADKVAQVHQNLRVLQQRQARAQAEVAPRPVVAGSASAPQGRPETAAAAEALGKARAQFVAGDVAGASAALAQIGTPEAQSLRANCLRADQLVQQGTAAASKGDNGGAARLFDQASALARSIGPGSSLEAKARQGGAKAWQQVGEAALAANDEAVARQAFEGVALADPANDAAKAELAKMEEQAQRLFQEGYAERLQDPDAARKKLQRVLNLTSPNGNSHHVAQVWLEKLAKPNGAR